MQDPVGRLVSHELLSSIIESVPIRIFWKDRDGRFLGCNRLFARDAGLGSADELIGKNDFDMGWREQAEHYRADDRRVMDSGTSELGYEEPQDTPDGGRRWLRTSKVPLRDDAGEVIGILGIYEDISDRKQAAENLHLTRFVSDHAPDPIVWVDAEGRICYANDAMICELGYSRDELTGMTIPDIDPDMTPERWRRHWQKLQQKNRLLFETELRCREGDIIPVEVSANFVRFDHYEYNVAFVRNIRERKAMEAQLRTSEACFRTMIEQAPLAMQVVAPDGRTLRVNRAWEKLWGVSIEALVDYNLLQDAQLERLGLLSDIRRAFGGEPVTIPPVEYSLADTPEVASGGGSFWVRSLIYPVRDADGSVREIVLMQEDMSERIRAEAALQESEARFRDLFENSPDPCWIINEEGMFTICNRAAATMLGFSSPEELQATHPADISPARQPNGRDSFEMANAMMAIALEKGVHRFEWEHCRRNGERIPVEVTLARIEVAGMPRLYCIWRDISGRKALEERLRYSEKMEAIGTLVGGIAHDFNNMLAAMQGNLYLARQQMREAGLGEEQLVNIERLADRAAGMVRQLLTFARKDMVAMHPLCLNDLIGEASQLTRSIVPDDIACRISMPNEPLEIEGDAAQLQQILLNLLRNAVDALEAQPRPELRCSLTPFVADEAFRQRHPEQQGKYFACLSVEDNGHGIGSDHLEKIFEPFFTTREVGRGTGLGLATLYGAVQRHGGSVEVQSEPGRGSAFRVYLPLRIDKAPTVQPTPGIAEAGETILVVDDEPDVRRITGEVLAHMGYRVLEAADGQEALSLLDDEPVDLVISDVAMPRMGGDELFHRVRQRQADLPFILAAGDDRRHVLGEEPDDRLIRLVEKPFDFDLLSRQVRQLLTVRKG